MINYNKLPNKVTVFGVPHRIRYTKKLPVLDGEECYGIIHHNKGTIIVGGDRGKKATWQTLWHEIFHAIFHLGRIPKEIDEEILMDIL